MRVKTPAIDCKEAPVTVVMATGVLDEPLLMISRFPLMVVMPPRLTVAMEGEMITSPSTFVHAVRVLRSDCELMLKVAEVHAGLAEEVVVLCACLVSTGERR